MTRSAAAAIVVLALAACGPDHESTRPPPAPPPPLSPADLRPTTSAPEIPPGAPRAVSFRQVTLLYSTREKPHARSRADAFDFAKSLIARLKAGEPMETLLKYTDDLDAKTGRPFNSGSVSLAQDSPALPAIKKAAFSTPVGAAAPEPIDAGVAFVVIFRDA